MVEYEGQERQKKQNHDQWDGKDGESNFSHPIGKARARSTIFYLIILYPLIRARAQGARIKISLLAL
jgi:hypothetical protein